MLAKLLQKPANSSSEGSPTSADVAPRVSVHYGIPSTASTLTFDPIQHLLAVGTLDGRIKVIGGDNIEGLLMSPKPTPFKYLEFLQNQGFIVSISNENEIQVWDLESRCISSNLQWESNITAFHVIYGTHYMYMGDEYGFLSVLKYDAEEGKILQLPYHVPANLVAETADVVLPSNQSIVGVLPQPLSSGNRVLIAYENGLIVLWDITEDRAVLVRGSKDLQLKDEILAGSSSYEGHEHLDDLSDREEGDKEICSLCWVSTDGSILAVGYVDGDILLWNLSVPESSKGQKAQEPSNKVVKMQLSSEDRRLPIIVLHWSPTKAKNGCGGQLFVYGGEEIGSEEVLTILELDWSSGISMLKCVHRVDLPLNGSFSDMIVMPSSSEMEDNEAASLLVLTTPGQLHFYNNDSLSILKSEPEKKHSILAIQYPATVPTVEPRMTVGKLFLVTTVGSRTLLETVSAAKLKTRHNMSGGMNGWPLTGGVPGKLTVSEDTVIERLYIAGYQDGTVRVWDATFPVLSLLLVLEVEVQGNEISGANASISAVEFSSTSLTLAIGNDFGLVCLYKLDGTHEKSSLHLITQEQQEVYGSPHEKEFQCAAIFSLLNSPVSCLQWVTSGDKLAVGYESGQVAMLETSSLSVLFLTDTALSSRSRVISLAVRTLPNIQKNSLIHSENEISNYSDELAFVLTGDGHCILIGSTTGKMICQPVCPKEASVAISLCILEENASFAEGSEEPFPVSSEDANNDKSEAADGAEVENNVQSALLRPKFMDSLILICCENALYLYSSKSIIQGDNNSISNLNLAKPCSWTTIFKKHAKEYGLIIVYQSGDIEIRSLPDFKVLGSTSLISILRWNFKMNMEKLISSLDKGQIALVNGCEYAIVSLLAFENDFRMPESLPCLHDKVLAAAADATSSFYEDKTQKQITVPGVFGGIIKGFKGFKKDASNSEARETLIAHLESIFSRFPFSVPLKNLENYEGEVEFNIDDVAIDELVSVSSSSFKKNNDKKEKEAEREQLFEGGSADTKPRLRTREEIIAKYRKTGDATSAASQAKDKLLERQEKLEKLSRRTEELQSGAESFASMAKELAKNMERRKWWNV